MSRVEPASIAKESSRRVSLEAIVESGDLELPVLHPGGLESTRELAEMCRVRSGLSLLDVASGAGESACYLAREFGCKVTGIDHSAYMIETSRRKARERGLAIEFEIGDAQNLPFEAETFDAVVSECTTCALDKERAISEMVRVTVSGGYVGISDLFWREDAAELLKSKLAELEGEHPETMAGWIHLFERAGLCEVQTKDFSHALATMTKEMRKELGVLGEVKLTLKVIRRWGITALGRVLASERIFRSKHLGYVLVVGRRAVSSVAPLV